MANYPDVRVAQRVNDKDALNKALHIAFEDQLVQKVMPKLRGIDTRDKCKSKTECLDKILAQLNTGIAGNPFNLTEDFNLACELGYGQFIWQSANYLKEMECSAPTESASGDGEQPSGKSTQKPPEASGGPIIVPQKPKSTEPNQQHGLAEHPLKPKPSKTKAKSPAYDYVDPRRPIDE